MDTLRVGARCLCVELFLLCSRRFSKAEEVTQDQLDGFGGLTLARPLFLDVDDDVGLAQLLVEARILPLQLFHFVCQRMALGLGPAFLRSQGLPHPLSSFTSPIDQQRGVQTFAREKRTDAAADGGSRLRFAQDAHFVFRGIATPLGSSHDFGVRMRGGRRGFGRDWRSTALRLATLASASFRASPGP
jgi:hypothetical protein